MSGNKMKSDQCLILICCVILMVSFSYGAKSNKDETIKLDDARAVKKLLRTKTNVLIVYSKSANALSSWLPILKESAKETIGKASIAIIDCGSAKKVCKKYKANPSSVKLMHYKNGEFHKEYDRKKAAKSLTAFLFDPSGDAPWEEDDGAVDVNHVTDPRSFQKLLTTQKLPVLMMFYAPWCGYCKRLKPEYAGAASDLKGQAVLAGMDVDRPENSVIREQFNITGFPTLIYFKNGNQMIKFSGENTRDGIVKWVKNPTAPKPPVQEKAWADEDNEVHHLKDSNFDDHLKENPSVLVMFYAPWCGHCKSMKPEYDEAAKKLLAENIVGSLAAVDATKEQVVSKRYDIKGFPTVKYFKNGELTFDFNERTADKIVEFMKDPKEPPPPPKPEAPWDETESEVVHLTDETFKKSLKKKKHSLVMFYAPWCGHCKKAKPEFNAAAEAYKEDGKVMFAAIDCTKFQGVCTSNDVSGYPTLKYFNYGKNEKKYSGGREEADFVAFMSDPTNPNPVRPKPKTNPEDAWKNIAGSKNLHHLTDATFDKFIEENKNVLVMFYAPWCGHCTAMKPAYGEAASKLITEKIDGILATVDATVENTISSKYEVKGFPTLKLFKNGKFSEDYEQGRSTAELVNFMKKLSEPKIKPKEEKGTPPKAKIDVKVQKPKEPVKVESEKPKEKPKEEKVQPKKEEKAKKDEKNKKKSKEEL